MTEQLNSTINDIMAVARHSAATPSTASAKTALTKKEPPATSKQIASLVLEVELSHQIKPPLTDQQRVQLVRDLARLGETEPQLRKRAESVKLNAQTFGTIAFKYWVQDIVCLRAEADRTARHLAAQYFAQFAIKDLWDEDVLLQDAHTRFSLLHSDEYERRVAVKLKKLEDGAEQARQLILKMSRGQQARLLKRAVKQGIFGRYDDIILENITLKFIAGKLAPLLLKRAT